MELKLCMESPSLKIKKAILYHPHCLFIEVHFYKQRRIQYILENFSSRIVSLRVEIIYLKIWVETSVTSVYYIIYYLFANYLLSVNSCDNNS